MSFDEIREKLPQSLYKEPNCRIQIFYVYFCNEILAQTFSKFLMDLNCLSENVSISDLGGHIKQFKACPLQQFLN